MDPATTLLLSIAVSMAIIIFTCWIFNFPPFMPVGIKLDANVLEGEA